MADLISQAIAANLPSFRVVPPDLSMTPDQIMQKTKELGTLADGTQMSSVSDFLVPSSRQFASIVNSASRVYSYRFDEAMRDSFVSARAMRRDAFLEGLLEERILPTINRTWQLEIDNDRDPEQCFVRDEMTKIIKSIPDFDAFKRAQLDAVWFGRSGCQWGWKRNSDLDNRWGIPRWDPIHGDSIQFTFDGIPAILLDTTTTAWYASNGAKWQGSPGDPPGDLVPTDRGGNALCLHRPYWRDRFSIHRHILRKSDYFEGELAGSVQGLGIRGLIYWHYVVRTDALTWMLAYMQAVGQMDLLVFNYPAGNYEAQQNQEANAQKIIGKAAIACPRNPTGNWPAVEQIQMNSAGLKALHDLVADYFDRHIERLIVGQSMSSGADKGDGLGGTGRAMFAKATKDEILVADTNRLDHTLTNDLVGPIRRYNFSKVKFPVRFKSILPNLEAENKVESGLKLISVNIPVKMDEMRTAAGFTRPEEGDEVVGAPLPQMPPGAPPGMGGPPSGPMPSGMPSVADLGMQNPMGGGMPGGPMQGSPMGPNATMSGGNVGFARQGPTRMSRGLNPVRYMTPDQEREAFEAAIDKNYLDSNNHVVFADWLEDNGHSDEAAFRRSVGNWIQKRGGEDFRRKNNLGFGHGYYIPPDDLPEGVEEHRVPRSTGSVIPWRAIESGTGMNKSLLWKDYRGMEEGLRRAFMSKLEEQRRQQPPEQLSRYDGSPAASAGTAASPAMGYPGGGNTYIPAFDEDDRRRPPTGYARKVGKNWREQDVSRDQGKFKQPDRSKRMDWTNYAENESPPQVHDDDLPYWLGWIDPKNNYHSIDVLGGEHHSQWAQKNIKELNNAGLGDALRSLKDQGWIRVTGGGRADVGRLTPSVKRRLEDYFLRLPSGPFHVTDSHSMGAVRADSHSDLFEGLDHQSRQRQAAQEPESPDTYQKTNYEAVAKPVQPTEKQYSSTQVNLTGDAAIKVMALGGLIPLPDLHEKGLEKDAHITILYGLETSDPIEVARLLNGAKPFKFELGGIGVFEGSESGKDYDVIYVEVTGNDLHRLRKKLAVLPHESTHPKYKPHATVAYVTKGKGKEVAASLQPVNLKCEADTVVFSDKNRAKTFIKLIDGADTQLQYAGPDPVTYE